MIEERYQREIDYLVAHPTPEEAKPGPLSTPAGPVDPEATEMLAHRSMGGVQLKRLDYVKQVSTEWLWPGRIPFGKLTILDGNPGQGKSTVTMAIAAAISSGQVLPDGRRLAPTGTIILSAEDGLDDTILPRLNAHGADTSRIHALEAVVPLDNDPERPWSLPADIDALRYTLGATGARLVIIDPLMAYLGSVVDSYRDQDVRSALHPLKDLAQETGAAILMVRHLNKQSGGLAVTRGGGSIGIIGAARVGLIIGTDPNDETGEQRVLAVTKNNLSRVGQAIGFHLEASDDVSVVRWDGPSDHTAETILATVDPDDVADVGRAADIIKYALGAGAQPAPDVIRSCRQAGLSDKHIQRARRMLHVYDAPGNPVYWAMRQLPPDDQDF